MQKADKPFNPSGMAVSEDGMYQLTQYTMICHPYVTHMFLEIIPVKIIIVVQHNMNFFGNIIHELSMTENEKLHLRYNKSYNVIKYEC